MSIGRERVAIQALPAYKPGKAAAQGDSGPSAIKLSSNENPLPPVAAVQQAVNDAIAGINRYPDHRATVLRATIAEWIGVSPQQVTAGNGSIGLLQQLFLSYVDPGDEVVFPWRSFEAYPIFTQLMGGKSVNTALVENAFDLEATASSVSANTKLVLLATPNNPTGTALSTTEIAEFVRRVPSSTIVVIDEAYKEFMNPALGDSVHDLLPHFPNILVLRTFSKTHGLAGVRAGYAVADPELIATIDKTLLPFAVSSVAQAAAIAAIVAFDEIKQRVEQIRLERERVAAALAEMGWRIPKSEANFVYIPTGEITEVTFATLEKHGIITRPFPGEGIRVTVSTQDENNQFLKAMKTVAPS